MFGGKLEAGAGNVTDELWVFGLPGRSWSRRSPVPLVAGQLFAVEGHSAHVVELEGGEAVMLVFFGYSSIYTYVSSVQEYNLSESVRVAARPSTWPDAGAARWPAVVRFGGAELVWIDLG